MFQLICLYWNYIIVISMLQEKEKAATTIQAGYRGYTARQEVKKIKDSKEGDNATDQPAADQANETPQPQGEGDGTAKSDEDKKDESPAEDGAKTAPPSGDNTQK